MAKKKLMADDVEFVDAVFRIPKNSVRAKIKVTIDEHGKTYTGVAEFGPAELREAINLFEETVRGDYPKYVLTEEGKRYAEQLMKEERE